MLALVEHAEVALEEQRGAMVGELRVGAFARAARGLLPATLVRLAEDHPRLDVRMVELDPPDGLAAVARASSRTWPTGSCRDQRETA